MKSLIHKLFVEHWPRKLLALLLATVIWFVVNQSLTVSRVISNIPVRIVNIPPGKTVEGLQLSGRLAKRINVTLVGNKTLLEELSPHDFEIVLDAQGRPDEWTASISTKNIASLNPEVDLSSGIKRVYHPNLPLRMTAVVTDKIPVVITKPVGEAPRGYQFLDVWPYRLWLTVTGSEVAIRQLKGKEQRMTFNLSDISKAQLDELSQEENTTHVVTFSVPEQWKQLSLPLLSENPLAIDDPQAKELRLDFLQRTTFPIDNALPVTLYFPPDTPETLYPDKIKLAPSPLLKEVNGMAFLTLPLYAKNVDRLFSQIVRNRMQLTILLSPKPDKQGLDWSLEFIDARHLEDLYVASLLAPSDAHPPKTLLREEYVRNRFRSYMKHFQLYLSEDRAFDPLIELKENRVYVLHHAD